MYCLFEHIKHKVKKEERDQIIEPTYEEYKAFFDEFDGARIREFILQYKDDLLNEDFICIEDNKYFVAMTVMVGERFERELRLKEGIPYYLPDKVELLKYEDISYFEETPEYVKLRDFVRKLYWRRSKADEITGILRGTCTNSNALKDLDLILAEYDVKVKNDKQAEELVELIMDLANKNKLNRKRSR